jgi:hypothetical protein
VKWWKTSKTLYELCTLLNMEVESLDGEAEAWEFRGLSFGVVVRVESTSPLSVPLREGSVYIGRGSFGLSPSWFWEDIGDAEASRNIEWESGALEGMTLVCDWFENFLPAVAAFILQYKLAACLELAQPRTLDVRPSASTAAGGLGRCSWRIVADCPLVLSWDPGHIRQAAPCGSIGGLGWDA